MKKEYEKCYKMMSTAQHPESFLCKVLSSLRYRIEHFKHIVESLMFRSDIEEKDHLLISHPNISQQGSKNEIFGQKQRSLRNT